MSAHKPNPNIHPSNEKDIFSYYFCFKLKAKFVRLYISISIAKPVYTHTSPPSPSLSYICIVDQWVWCFQTGFSERKLRVMLTFSNINIHGLWKSSPQDGAADLYWPHSKQGLSMSFSYQGEMFVQQSTSDLIFKVQ